MFGDVIISVQDIDLSEETAAPIDSVTLRGGAGAHAVDEDNTLRSYFGPTGNAAPFTSRPSSLVALLAN